MVCRGRCTVAIAVLAALLAGPHLASATVRASVTSTQRGWIGLRVAGGRPGSRVLVREGGVRRSAFRLDRRGRAVARRVAVWRCARRERTLVIDDGPAGGVGVSTTTPGCDHRLALQPRPLRPHAGRGFAIHIADRWRVGRLAATLCLEAPAGTGECARVRIHRAGSTVRLRGPRPGRWRIRVRAAGLDLGRDFTVLPAGHRLSVVAAGDSMMVPVARKLVRLLGRRGVIVRTDVHLGAGLSTPYTLDWAAHARRTALKERPDVVVLLLGGGEGWPFGPISCCGDAWTAAYALRAGDVVRGYLRGGTAQVYWLSLPAPGPPRDPAPLQAANAAVAAALAGFAPWARQLDLAALLTPGFTYRREMPIDGRMRIVRLLDGLHLAWAGANLAAGQVIGALEADGVLGAADG